MTYNHEETKLRYPSAAREVERLRDRESKLMAAADRAFWTLITCRNSGGDEEILQDAIDQIGMMGHE